MRLAENGNVLFGAVSGNLFLLSATLGSKRRDEMRIGTYNVLGLRGFPPEEAQKEVGEPGGGGPGTE